MNILGCRHWIPRNTPDKGHELCLFHTATGGRCGAFIGVLGKVVYHSATRTWLGSVYDLNAGEYVKLVPCAEPDEAMVCVEIALREQQERGSRETVRDLSTVLGIGDK